MPLIQNQGRHQQRTSTTNFQLSSDEGGQKSPKIKKKKSDGLTVLSISTDSRRKASAISLREIGYFSPKLKELQEGSFKAPVDTVGYSTQTSCLPQILLKPLGLKNVFKIFCTGLKLFSFT